MNKKFLIHLISPLILFFSCRTTLSGDSQLSTVSKVRLSPMWEFFQQISFQCFVFFCCSSFYTMAFVWECKLFEWYSFSTFPGLWRIFMYGWKKLKSFLHSVRISEGEKLKNMQSSRVIFSNKTLMELNRFTPFPLIIPKSKSWIHFMNYLLFHLNFIICIIEYKSNSHDETRPIKCTNFDWHVC